MLAIRRRVRGPGQKLWAPRQRSAIAVLILAAALNACDDRPQHPIAPEADVSRAAAPQQPFYYHQREPVHLRLDSTRLVVASSLSSPDQAITDALDELGLTASSIEQMIQEPSHRLVHLSTAIAPATVGDAVTGLRQDGRFDFASSVYQTLDKDADVILLNRVSVRFRSSVARAQIDSLNAALNTRLVREPSPDSGFVTYWLAYPGDRDPLELAAFLYGHPLVEWATPDFVTNAERLGPTDPYYSQQYYLKNAIKRNNIPVDINIEPAWNLTKGYYTISVAVIDDGVETGPPDHDHVAGVGWDAFGRDCAADPDCESNPLSTDPHGTHVAGIIVAVHDGPGMAGAAPEVYVTPVRIFRGTDVASCAQVGNAIRWAWYWRGVDVLSNSWRWGAPCDDITNAINDGTIQGRDGKGATIVFAAGNPSNRDGTGACGQPVCPVEYPASLPSVIAVGAINQSGDLTNYTPEGPELDLVAPSGHYAGWCQGDVVSRDLTGNDGICILRAMTESAMMARTAIKTIPLRSQEPRPPLRK